MNCRFPRFSSWLCRMQGHWLFLLLLTILELQGAAQHRNAQEYYDFLWKHEVTIGEELIKLSRLLTTYDSGLLHNQLAIVNARIAMSLDSIENTESFPRSKYLKEAFLEYLETLKHLCRHDWKLLIDILTKSQLAPDDKIKVEKIYSDITRHVERSAEILHVAKARFAERHQLILPQDPYHFYLTQPFY